MQRSSSSGYSQGPRKVIVGTTVFSLFDTAHPDMSLDRRIEVVRGRLKEMAADSKVQHGRGLDIAVFPENVLNDRCGKTLEERSVRWDDSLRVALGSLAREQNTWLCLCFDMLTADAVVHNSAVLFDRNGEVAGIYRKVYCLPDADGNSVEGGKRPGTEIPVFETEFGRVGILICFDMGFDDLLEAYAEKRAELLLWPSMSPQTLLPRLYARRFGYYIVSSTPRDSACVFDPLGEIAASVRGEGGVTAEIDLDYRIVHWQPELRGGEVLRERYGDGAGFRYHESEDYGIFWSNDPGLPIAKMLRDTGISTDAELRSLARSARLNALG